MPGPLSDITVIDLTRVLAGPYCTMMLAEMGARVIKVEKPGTGDDARQFGPFIHGESAYFMSLNRGKESVALDLKQEAEREQLKTMLAKADVLVENFRPGAMARLGLDYATLSKTFPKLIYASVSGFGQTGPNKDKAAYDIIVQAMGGLMSITGQPGGEPTRVGTSIGDITAGMFTANGILAALHERHRTGKGQHIDVAMLDCQIAILENAIARYVATGEAPTPLGSRHPAITPFDAFQAKDGYLVIAAGNDALFAKLCAALGVERLAEDARFATNAARTDHVDTLKEHLEATLKQQPRGYWLSKLEEAGIPCGPIQNVAEVVEGAQANARNMIVEAGGIRMAGNPVKFSNHADEPTRTPAPKLSGR